MLVERLLKEVATESHPIKFRACAKPTETPTDGELPVATAALAAITWDSIVELLSAVIETVVLETT